MGWAHWRMQLAKLVAHSMVTHLDEKVEHCLVALLNLSHNPLGLGMHAG